MKYLLLRSTFWTFGHYEGNFLDKTTLSIFKCLMNIFSPFGRSFMYALNLSIRPDGYYGQLVLFLLKLNSLYNKTTQLFLFFFVNRPPQTTLNNKGDLSFQCYTLICSQLRPLTPTIILWTITVHVVWFAMFDM